jgi:hypothetical protein
MPQDVISLLPFHRKIEILFIFYKELTMAAKPLIARVVAKAFESKTPLMVDISRYTEPFDAYPTDFEAFCQDHIKLPGIRTLRGQAYALMAQPENRGQRCISRPEATAFFDQIGPQLGETTNDSIQPFNKTIGVKRVKLRGYYCLAYPFELDMTDIQKRKHCSIQGDRNEYINQVKDFWKHNLVDVPNEEWQLGHLDPTIADASEQNLAYQPPLQGKYRNRFKWDQLFHKMWPTGEEVSSKMDEYYTEAEQKIMFEALKKKFT